MLNTFSRKLVKSVALGAAVLTVALAAVATSGARPVAAIDDDPQNPDPKPPTATPAPKPTYKVQLTFETVELNDRDDGWEDVLFGGDHHLEVYGKLTASNGVTGFNRLFGTDKFGTNPSICPNDGVSWSTGGVYAKCLRGYGLFDLFIGGAKFADTPMCNFSAATSACVDSFGFGRNSGIFNLSAGQKLNWNINMMDRDELTSHDTVCNVGTYFGPFTDAQLQPSNGSWVNIMEQANNGNASCKVRVTLKRVP
jgi:hypothetical protein